MIKKTENCLYCGEKMESITAKKKFCSDLHRVYFNRELKRVKAVKVDSVEQPTISVRNEIEQMIWEEEQKIIHKNK